MRESDITIWFPDPWKLQTSNRVPANHSGFLWNMYVIKEITHVVTLLYSKRCVEMGQGLTLSKKWFVNKHKLWRDSSRKLLCVICVVDVTDNSISVSFVIIFLKNIIQFLSPQMSKIYLHINYSLAFYDNIMLSGYPRGRSSSLL